MLGDQGNLYKVHRRSNSYDLAMSREASPVNHSTVRSPVPQYDRNSLVHKQIDDIGDDTYLIKWIEFNHSRVPILLQNRNGPCPLLAIANILLLRNRIHLNANAGEINTDRLTEMIAGYILQLDTENLSADDRANHEHNIQEVLTILPKLQTGIDVNLKFNGVHNFEYTRECIVFDLLGIQLLHGWIVDPQNYELQRIINSNGSSYNQLIEKMLHQRHSDNRELVQESILIEQFLDENRSQLTHYGILKLNETMRDNQLAVLFRNNHFSTIWKHNGQLLLLVSDQGFINHPMIVFETLNNIDNDSSFTDGYGRKWQGPESVNISRDQELAVALQNEEQRRFHEEQSRQQQRYPQQVPYDGLQKRSNRKVKPSEYDDYDDGCTCILL